MIDVYTLTPEQFHKLPLVIEGESKEVRYAGDGLVVIRFKPTVYSFTQNRCAHVPGSHIPRLKASKILVDVLKANGIRHAYREIGEEFVLADLVMPHQVEFEKYRITPFVPPDLTNEQITALPKAPPIEIIAKRYLTGTTKHGSVGLAGSCVRSSHPFYAGMELIPDGPLPEMLIRFDWRNPLKQDGKGKRMADQILNNIAYFGTDPHMQVNRILRWMVQTLGAPVTNKVRAAIEAYGDRCADTVLPKQIANWFTDVKQAQRTAFFTATALEKFLASRNIVFYDLCMFIDESGTLVYGEISPDCGRYRHLDHGSLDKDVWRSGGSSQDVIEKWHLFVNLLLGEVR